MPYPDLYSYRYRSGSTRVAFDPAVGSGTAGRRPARRPTRGPIDAAKLMPVAYAVAMVFIALSVLTLVADVIDPVKLL